MKLYNLIKESYKMTKNVAFTLSFDVAHAALAKS